MFRNAPPKIGKKVGIHFYENVLSEKNLPLISKNQLTWLLFLIAKLPKWFGERPGKKAGDPESPDEDEEAGAEAAPADDYPEE